MISGLAEQNLGYVMEALLPRNQRWAPGGSRWDNFIGEFSEQQRAVIRKFFEYVVHSTAKDTEFRAGAEHALWMKLYD
jgi:hypothetical protein